jgi:hypothetical protein
MWIKLDSCVTLQQRYLIVANLQRHVVSLPSSFVIECSGFRYVLRFMVYWLRRNIILALAALLAESPKSREFNGKRLEDMAARYGNTAVSYFKIDIELSTVITLLVQVIYLILHPVVGHSPIRPIRGSAPEMIATQLGCLSQCESKQGRWFFLILHFMSLRGRLIIYGNTVSAGLEMRADRLLHLTHPLR